MVLAGFYPGSTGASDPAVRWLVAALLAPLIASCSRCCSSSCCSRRARSGPAHAPDRRHARCRGGGDRPAPAPRRGVGNRSPRWQGGRSTSIGAVFRGLLIGVAILTAVHAARILLTVDSADGEAGAVRHRRPGARASRGRPRKGRRCGGPSCCWRCRSPSSSARRIGWPLSLANPDRTSVSEVRAAFEALPDDALVLMAMDADLGTYPEILPAVRGRHGRPARTWRIARLRERQRRGARHRRGRAGAIACRRHRGDALLDLGFISGVEAGLVLLVGDALPSGPPASWPTA